MNTTSPALDPGCLADANTVSWQSAFWALMALALNCMFQDAGWVFSDRSIGDARFLLCLSPFFCAVDALELCFQLGKHFFLERRNGRRVNDFGTALGLTAAARFGGAEAYEAPKLLLAKALLFGFGALPQFIKVWGYHGVLWVQLYALMYMVSFLVCEAFRFFGRRRIANAEAQDRGRSVSWSYSDDFPLLKPFINSTPFCIAFGTQLLVVGVTAWRWFSSQSAVDEDIAAGRRKLAPLGLMLLFFLLSAAVVCVIQVIAQFLVDEETRKTVIDPFIEKNLVYFVIPMPLLSLLPLVWIPDALIPLSQVFLGIGFGFVAVPLGVYVCIGPVGLFPMHLAVMFSLAYSHIADNDPAWIDEVIQAFDKLAVCIFYFVSNLAFGIGYFILFYNTVGTAKESWTDVFG